MQRVEQVAEVPAPPEELFAYLSNLDHLPEWQAGVVDAQRTSDGPLTVGATATVTRELMGQRITAPLRVTSIDAPRHLAIESEVSGVRASAVLDLEPTSDGTRLAFAMEIRGSGLTSFMEPMIAGAARGDIDSSLARLRERFSPDGG